MITTEIKRVKNHINGEWVESTGTEVEAVPNPATGKIIAYVPLSPKEDVEKLLKPQKQHTKHGLKYQFRIVQDNCINIYSFYKKTKKNLQKSLR